MSNKNSNLSGEGQWLAFAGFCLDTETYQLYRDRDRVPLPVKAAQVLELLIRRHGTLVARDEIHSIVWGDRHVDFEASLNTAVRSIRRALTDDASQPRFVETIPRQGYRFLQTPVFSDSRRQSRQSVLRRSRNYALAATVLIVVASSALWFTVTQQPSAQTDAPRQDYVTSPGYEDFLHGRYALSQGNRDQAEQRLSAAIQADPQLAPAYVSLARANVGNRRFGWEKIIAARQLVEKASEIDADLVSAHILKAGLELYYWRNHELAQQHIDRALTLTPDNPDAFKVAAYLNIIDGDVDSALDAISRAHELRPLSPALNADYGWILYKAGNWNDAERLCKTSVELSERSQFALECVIHINHSQGDYAEAAEFGLALMALRGAAEHEIHAIREITDASEREAAFWQWTLDWFEGKTGQVSDTLSKRGIALTMLGRYDDAVEVFEQAFTKNGEPFLAFFAVDPRVHDLQSHSQFPSLAMYSRTPVSVN